MFCSVSREIFWNTVRRTRANSKTEQGGRNRNKEAGTGKGVMKYIEYINSGEHQSTTVFSFTRKYRFSIFLYLLEPLKISIFKTYFLYFSVSQVTGCWSRVYPPYWIKSGGGHGAICHDSVGNSPHYGGKTFLPEAFVHSVNKYLLKMYIYSGLLRLIKGIDVKYHLLQSIRSN